MTQVEEIRTKRAENKAELNRLIAFWQGHLAAFEKLQTYSKKEIREEAMKWIAFYNEKWREADDQG